MGITVRDAETGQIHTEKVQDEFIIRMLYGTPIGRLLLRGIFSRRWFSRLYSLFYRSRFSRQSIADFIRRYDVDVAAFIPCEYRSFNDFFIRRFMPGRRPFVADTRQLPATAEARYSGWRSSDEAVCLDIKQAQHTRATLLANDAWLAKFAGGPVLLARLAPQDYHRFHVVDDGEIVEHYAVDGALHTVNPLATNRMSGIFALNKRCITIQKTRNFGLIAYIDIGAMTIGSIENTVAVGDVLKRGDERGYFQFGGSTIVILGEPDAWIPQGQILESTSEQVEVLVRLGRAVAIKESV